MRIAATDDDTPARPAGLIDLLPGAIGLLVLGVQPIMLGTLHAAGRLDGGQIGIAAMLEMLMLSGGVFLGQWLGGRIAFRTGVAMAFLGLALANLATLIAVGMGLVALRGLAGLPAGWLVWVTATAIVGSLDPTASTGRFILVQVAMQTLLAALANALAGQSTAFVPSALAVLALFGLTMRSRFSAGSALRPTVAPEGSWNATGLVVLLTAMAFQAGVMGGWVYLEPLAHKARLDADALARAAPLSLAAQLAGCFAAIRLSRLLGWFWPVCAGTVLIALGFAGLSVSDGAGQFLAIQMTMGFVWTFVSPFLTAMALAADGSGRIAVAVPGAIMLGSAVGPGLAAFAVERAGTPGVLQASAALAGLALALTVWERVRSAGRDLRG